MTRIFRDAILGCINRAGLLLYRTRHQQRGVLGSNRLSFRSHPTSCVVCLPCHIMLGPQLIYVSFATNAKLGCRFKCPEPLSKSCSLALLITITKRVGDRICVCACLFCACLWARGILCYNRNLTHQSSVNEIEVKGGDAAGGGPVSWSHDEDAAYQMRRKFSPARRKYETVLEGHRQTTSTVFTSRFRDMHSCTQSTCMHTYIYQFDLHYPSTFVRLSTRRISIRRCCARR